MRLNELRRAHGINHHSTIYSHEEPETTEMTGIAGVFK